MLMTMTSKAQKVTVEELFTDKISIRAMEISDGKVWYSGTDSKVGFVEIARPENHQQIILSEKKLQFRTLAQDANNLYTINIESPAYFFKINKKTFKHEVIFQDKDSSAFYDAFHFVSPSLAFAFSDPTGRKLKLAMYKDASWSFVPNLIFLNNGEAAFAASNSNIASSKKFLWVATGGKSSRILRYRFQNKKFEIFETPFLQGTSSQGIYSVDFLNNKFGITVGGDYTKPSENKNNIATTKNGGKTWQIQASGQNAGYTTCVKIKPGSNGKEILSVGDHHISFSADYGKTWKKLADEKGLYVCKWLDEKTAVLAGKNRIVKLIFETF